MRNFMVTSPVFPTNSVERGYTLLGIHSGPKRKLFPRWSSGSQTMTKSPEEDPQQPMLTFWWETPAQESRNWQQQWWTAVSGCHTPAHLSFSLSHSWLKVTKYLLSVQFSKFLLPFLFLLLVTICFYFSFTSCFHRTWKRQDESDIKQKWKQKKTLILRYLGTLGPKCTNFHKFSLFRISRPLPTS